jgi:hypothetical protein
VFDPAIGMAALWVAVRPMDNAPLFVPLVFAAKLNRVARIQGHHAAGQIDIVRHQQFLPGVQFDDEFLVPNSIVIVRQNADYASCILNLDIPSMLRERLR